MLCQVMFITVAVRKTLMMFHLAAKTQNNAVPVRHGPD